MKQLVDKKQSMKQQVVDTFRIKNKIMTKPVDEKTI